MVRMRWADEQEMRALKAVLFGADGVIPVQSHRCEYYQDQQQVQFPLRTLHFRVQFHYPIKDNYHLLIICHMPSTALLAMLCHVILILQMTKLRLQESKQFAWVHTGRKPQGWDLL